MSGVPFRFDVFVLVLLFCCCLFFKEWVISLSHHHPSPFELTPRYRYFGWSWIRGLSGKERWPRFHSKHKINLSFVTWGQNEYTQSSEIWWENAFSCREIVSTFIMLLLSKAKDKTLSYIREWGFQQLSYKGQVYLGNFSGLLPLIWNGLGGKGRMEWTVWFLCRSLFMPH